MGPAGLTRVTGVEVFILTCEKQTLDKNKHIVIRTQEITGVSHTAPGPILPLPKITANLLPWCRIPMLTECPSIPLYKSLSTSLSNGASKVHSGVLKIHYHLVEEIFIPND